MRSRIIFAVVLLLFIALLYGFLQYNKPHRDIEKAKAAFEVDANYFLKEFSLDQSKAQEKYNNQVVLLTGEVDKIVATAKGHGIILIKGHEGLINCELDHDYERVSVTVHEHEMVALKGLYVGFDDLLGEIQLRNCTLIPK